MQRSLAATFRYPGVAHAYRHRPPYPDEVFEILVSLIVNEPRRVLDLGAGEGALARHLAPRVDHVDAVEVSSAMVEAGRRRPGGDRPNLTWLVEPAERLSRPGPYALVCAGASLHWMDWVRTFDQVTRRLTPGAVLALVDQEFVDLPWQTRLRAVIMRYSRNPDFDPTFSLPDELQRGGLLDVRGRRTTAPREFRQSVPEYVEQLHSTASLARELMSAAEAARFAVEVRAAVADYVSPQGELSMLTRASVVWGRPLVASG